MLSALSSGSPPHAATTAMIPKSRIPPRYGETRPDDAGICGHDLADVRHPAAFESSFETLVENDKSLHSAVLEAAGARLNRDTKANPTWYGGSARAHRRRAACTSVADLRDRPA